MTWHEIKILTTEEAYDAVTEMLTSIGAGGVSIEDPNDIRRELEKPGTLDYADDEFIQSLGEDVVVKAYFPGTVNVMELTALVQEKLSFISNFLDTGKGFAGISSVNEEDWANGWKKYYKPVKISDRIVIKPSWEDYEKKLDEVVIELDPGMAFGTGTHETTRMCLQLIDRYVQKGDRAVDVGCGTGILSIAAAMLGAHQITAVDVDEVAVRVTQENCALNGVSENIRAFTGQLKDIGENKADLIIANIIANVIIDISGAVPGYLKPGGLFITSGIIRDRRDDVVDAYTKLGFEKLELLEMGEWVAVVFKCPDFS